MNENTVLLFALLRSAVCDKSFTEEERMLYAEEKLPALIAVAKKHDLAHLLAPALEKNDLKGQGSEKCAAETFKAMHRYEQLRYEFVRCCEALESGEVPFIPLKGAVIRQYYPEPWMRTSCDIDILVQEQDLQRAVKLLEDRLGYRYDGKGSHDVSMFSAGGSHIELHYDLVEDGRANDSSEILRRIWEDASPQQGSQYFYELSDEMFYFYHIAHMAKHFEIGGCGVRPFIDLWLLDHLKEDNTEKRDALLVRGGLLKFAEVSRHLSRIWFSGEPSDDIADRMGRFILYGGVYGSAENRVMIQQQKKGSKARYIFHRIFFSYDQLKYIYPILQKYPFLMPIMQVRRWLRILFKGKGSSAMRELKYSEDISSAEANETKELLNSIGL